jgi:hypothetical protein
MRVSASQVEKFLLCRRKWAFEKIDGLPPGTTTAAEFGKEGHEAIKTWLTTGALDPTKVAADILAIIQKAIKPGVLPTPRGPNFANPLLVESEFAFEVERESGAKHKFTGIFDCVVPPPLPEPRPVVVDHKFRSDPKFAMDESGLVRDVQAIIYSFAVLLMYPDSEQIENRWIYYFSTGKKDERPKKAAGVRMVRICRTPEEVEEQMGPILSVVDEMQKIVDEGKPAKEVPPCLTSCGAYGGCPFADLCESTPASRTAARVRQYSEQAVEVGKIDKPLPVREHKTKEEEMTLLDELREKRKAARAAESVPKAEKPEEREAEPKEKKSSALRKIEERRRESKDESEAPKKEVEKKAEAKKKVEKKEPEKKELPEPTFEEPAPTAHPNCRCANVPESLGTIPIAVLYVNCVPLRKTVSRVEDLAVEVARKVAKANGVEHWSHVEFGGGKGALEVAFEEWLDGLTIDLVRGIEVAVDSKSSVGCALLDLLIRKSREVVRAVS